MKRKTMRRIFVALFIVGIIVGYLLPGDLKTVTMTPLKAQVFDVPKKLGQLDQEAEFFRYTVLAETETGSVELLRVDDIIPDHLHEKENHIVYMFRGTAQVTVGNVNTEVGPGGLVVIPAGVTHSLERVGDTPVEIILFSTPSFVPEDIVYLEQG